MTDDALFLIVIVALTLSFLVTLPAVWTGKGRLQERSERNLRAVFGDGYANSMYSLWIPMTMFFCGLVAGIGSSNAGDDARFLDTFLLVVARMLFVGSLVTILSVWLFKRPRFLIPPRLRTGAKPDMEASQPSDHPD